ncbi:hypothetical protein T459_16692 [Capsicum annuum]|uniref:Uncharacterized protein n=1 Tax=Capsicum annuum TaxID=4072 RepID=A0A2G2Z9H0_CAPAN|nr:hypothetical protein T459_16692 [Capsicum annuum]
MEFESSLVGSEKDFADLVMEFVDLEMDLVDFVDLGIDSVDLGANFVDLEAGFVGWKASSGDLGMNFVDLEMDFVGLRMDFMDGQFQVLGSVLDGFGSGRHWEANFARFWVEFGIGIGRENKEGLGRIESGEGLWAGIG